MALPLLATAGLGALGSLAGGIFGGKANKKARKAQARSEANALAFQREGQQKAQTLLGPAADYSAALQLQKDLSGVNGPQAQQMAFGKFQADPKYAFLQQQGQEGALRGAAAAGQLGSGRTLADLAKFNTGLADQSYDQYYGRIADISGQGINAAQGLANNFTNSQNNMSNIVQQGGRDKADLAIQKGNIFTNALQGGLGSIAYGMGQYDPSKSSYLKSNTLY
jgi:hypothetical protein